MKSCNSVKNDNASAGAKGRFSTALLKHVTIISEIKFAHDKEEVNVSTGDKSYDPGHLQRFFISLNIKINFIMSNPDGPPVLANSDRAIFPGYSIFPMQVQLVFVRDQRYVHIDLNFPCATPLCKIHSSELHHMSDILHQYIY